MAPVALLELSVGLAAACSFLACCFAGAAWLLSDTRRVRRLERDWEEAFSSNVRRLEKLERAFPQWRTAMESIADEAADILKRAEAKRKRVEGAAGNPGNSQPLTREQYLAQVEQRFRRGGE